MKRTPKSLETKSSENSAAIDSDEANTSAGVSATQVIKEKSSVEDEVEFDAKVPGQVETDSTGKNVLLRDKDANDDTSELKLLDESLPDHTDEFDPYNSGSFDVSKSRSWKSRSRK